MSRHVFYSFHYDDRSRVAPILASRTLQGNLEADAAEWAKLKRSGDFAIKRWLEQQLKGRSCTVVLIGRETAKRAWVHYEIRRSWELGLGLIGVHIYRLNDAQGHPSTQGDNPFQEPASGLGELGATIPLFDPPEADAKLAARYVVDHLAQWAEQSVAKSRVEP